MKHPQKAPPWNEKNHWESLNMFNGINLTLNSYMDQDIKTHTM